MELTQIAEDLEAGGEPMRDGWVMTRILGILPPKLHHFRTAWDNVSQVDKTMGNMLERLRLEEDRLNEYSTANGPTSSNALVVKSNWKKGQNEDSTRQEGPPVCFKCGQKGHVKRHCRNKPCAKYVAYCKEHYSCNTCGNKGHFAKDCNKRGEDRRSNDTTNRSDSRQASRRALITVGLSTANVNSLNSRQEAKECWFQDCAATQHMTSHREWFSKYTQLDVPLDITIGDMSRLEAVGVRNVELEAYNGQEWYQVILEKVLYVPRLNFNLFPVSQTLDRNYIQIANKDMSIFKTPKEQETVAIAERDGNLFQMMLRREASNSCMIASSLRTWHERLAHQNITYVKDVLDQHQIGCTDDWGNYVCEGFIFGKQNRVSHPANEKVSSKQLDMVHVDLGEMPVQSLGGAKYFLLFKDDYSHYRTVYF